MDERRLFRFHKSRVCRAEEDDLKILVVHEVSYLSKIIYEFQILPEILSLLGHQVTIIDYDDTWETSASVGRLSLETTLYRNVHRAYPGASVTVRRPGMIRFPILSRVSGSVLESVEIARTIETEKPDVILLYAMPTVGIQSLVTARHYGIPVVFRAIDVSHELVPNVLLRFPTTLIEDFVFNAVDLNLALTPHLKRYIQTYGVSNQRIRLLPSGVDTSMFSPGPRDIPALAKRTISAGDLTVLFMGTLYPFCGLERIISEFPKVLAAHPTAKLLIAGTGEAESRLLRRVREKDLQRYVIFTGLLPYADLPALIRSADICINPFELNGITRNILPTKLFQYMTCGKPVLATALPGATSFLKGEEQGVLYSDLDSFTDTLIDLLSDPDRRTLLGDRAIAAARPYDWYEIARILVQWLQETAGCRSLKN